jgi:uncharacterized membrane protein YedE/YeeE
MSSEPARAVLPRALVGLLAGLLFGAGLALGGMTDPAVVQGFLDVAGDWNPALLGVMGGAVVAFLGYRIVFRTGRPTLAASFAEPPRRRPDAALLLGAGVFGIGWGLAGYCPGPALAALPAALPGTALFVAAMLAGLGAVRFWRSRPASSPTEAIRASRP